MLFSALNNQHSLGAMPTADYAYAKLHALRGNTLREAAPRLHELPLPENKGFGYCLRKSCSLLAFRLKTR
jgi:hypothetical protein